MMVDFGRIIGWKTWPHPKLGEPTPAWCGLPSRRRQLREVKANPAHEALANWRRLAHTLITQNVDDLHERGGSSDVVHMHGQLVTLRCTVSGQSEVRMADEDLGDGFLLCSCCAEPARLRPDIVWFGEMPLHMEAIYTAVDACEVFVVVGSSGHVYPAADLVHIAKGNGARTVLVNAEAPLNVDAFDEVHLGKAGELLPELVNTWLQTTV